MLILSYTSLWNLVHEQALLDEYLIWLKTILRLSTLCYTFGLEKLKTLSFGLLQFIDTFKTPLQWTSPGLSILALRFYLGNLLWSMAVLYYMRDHSPAVLSRMASLVQVGLYCWWWPSSSPFHLSSRQNGPGPDQERLECWWWPSLQPLSRSPCNLGRPSLARE